MQGKVVWITGASSGIGAAIAKKINALGGVVVLSARRKEALENLQKELSEPEKSFVLPLDLEQINTFSSKVEEVIQQYQKIDLLINNGGISQRGNVRETSLEVDRKIMEINYFGTVALTKAVLPYMIQQKSGHIVAISSITGKFGFFLRSSYAASKHAIKGFFESLRLEEEANNIKVSLVYPGQINTPISKSALDADGKPFGQMDQNQSRGMDVDQCAAKIVKGLQKQKKDIYVGGKEMLILKIQRFFPKLFYKVLKKQSPT